MKNKNKTTIIYVILGILIGYVSFLLGNEFLALGLAFVSLFLIAEILKKAFKIDSKFKWFWSNGGWMYLFIWFIVWVFLLNPPFVL
jgi:hypothetical protein